MNENTTKRRDWVKNAAIVFLTVMLILTFFSNTIMNYSLPEVATQNAMPASITAKIRGTGTIEASDPYSVVIKESRVIASVAVRQGDTVEKGDVLFTLEDAESAELQEAQKALEALELAYEKAIITADSSSELVNDVENGKVTSTQSKLAQIDGYNKKIENLEKAIAAYNDRIAEIEAQLSKMSGDGTVDTSGEKKALAEAEKNLTNAKTAVEAADKKLAAAMSTLEAVNSSVKLAEENKASCQTAYDEASARYEMLLARKTELEKKQNAAVEPSSGAEESSADASAAGEDIMAQAALTPEEQEELDRLNGTGDGSVSAAFKVLTEAHSALEAAAQAVTEAENAIAAERVSAQKAIDAARTEYNKAVDSETYYESKKAEAQKNLTNKENSTPDTGDRDKLNNEKADLSLKISKASSDKAEAENDLAELLQSFGKEVDLAEMLKQIREQKEQIADLEANVTDAVITAPVSGVVSTLNYVAGQTTAPDQPMAQIVMVEKGFTLSFPVTSDQARKISVGDVAEIQNMWYYNDIAATVAGFKADPSNPQNKLVIFNVTGDVQAGQSLSLAVGQKSANYDIVVPNSAIREDSNGKFILIVESKNGPLSNRYIATRVDVEVLASDDTMSAISGGLYGWEYVITTSTKPVEAGKQVRLADH